MGKALGNPEHLLVLGREGHADPLAEGRAVGAAVNGHIKHLAQRHTDQLALRVLGLEVQTAQHALGGTALVVLHKGLVDAGGGKIVDLVGLHKIATVITKNSRLDDLHFGNVGLDKIKLAHEVESPFYINVSIYIAIQLILYSILPLRARWRKNFVAAVTTAVIFRLVG